MGRAAQSCAGAGQPSRRVFIAGGAALGATALGAATWGAAPAAADAAAGPQAAVERLSPEWASAWVQTCYDLTWREGPSPTQAARCYHYLALAMYEACVGGMPRHRSLGGQLTALGPLPRPSGAIDWPVALSASALAVARAVYATAAQANRDTLDALHAVQVAQRRAAGVHRGTVANSLRHGQAVGGAIARWLAEDGSAAIAGRAYTPPVGESLWEPTHPNYRPAVEPYWSQVRPMVLRSADEVRPIDHVPFSTEPGSAFWQQADTVYQTSKTLTDEQRAIARFWTDNPLLSGLPSGHWMLTVAQVARARGLSLADTLEAYARLGVTLHDAFLNCWTWKYRFNLLRPSTYVRRHIDPEWVTFVNSPQFPEYTSGHSVASRAASTVLTEMLGSFAYVDDSHRDRGLPARSFDSFHHAANEAAQSRLYGGIHFPMGIENGKAQGDHVGALVLARLRTRK
ncbi:vanadium-dependent haloperoxidase [Knoellia sp. p5-6-4]|uniref:vanadium-dependent haloperoxidase n=1 Tax=unclassified Knoellia TaxID=2618719 RepID=UPI0023DB77E0|nr:vanadium-dependent haloperoxidase [Knoellia sp. p5-6-4]MDF2145525.1 vanadium-dependent haloperoxidase [Knoellia sp. p5-6-4]